jgi:hypothetical protein
MTRAEVEDAVRTWLDEHSVNPATGSAPDARLAVAALPITTFGAGTAGGVTWSVTATLFFPPDDEEHLGVKVARVLEHFERDLGAGAPLAGGGTLAWRGTDRGPHGRLDAPAGYETAVDVLLTVTPHGGGEGDSLSPGWHAGLTVGACLSRPSSPAASWSSCSSSSGPPRPPRRRPTARASPARTRPPGPSRAPGASPGR